jgi:HlyD family secretion protein
MEEASPLPSEADALLKSARAERLVARAAIEKMTIRAPIAGTVLQVNVRVGETAMPSAAQPLLVIGDLSNLRVRAELDDSDVGEIKVGQPVIVRAAAFPRREFAGKVTAIAPIVAAASTAPRGSRGPTDVEIVEVLIDLADRGPLVSGTKVDAYFRRAEAAKP